MQLTSRSEEDGIVASARILDEATQPDGDRHEESPIYQENQALT
jgi:hypothetical protein